MSEIKTLPREQRMVSAKTMKDVAKTLPMDGFNLTPDILGATYTVTNVRETEFNGIKTFMLTLRNEDRTINMSAAIYKRSRVLGETPDVKSADFYDGNQNILLRPKAENIWGGSQYVHQHGKGMKEDEDLEIPAKIHLEYAVLAVTADNQDRPVMSPFLYKGYRNFMESYMDENNGEFPRWENFVEYCAANPDKFKNGEPELFPHVKEGDPSASRFNLILKDVSDQD